MEAYRHNSRRRIALFCGGLVFAIVALAIRASMPGVNVIIHNTGLTRLEAVRLYVTGQSYFVGSLEAGDSRSMIVISGSESDLEVEFNDQNGSRRRLSTGCYLLPKSQGVIQLSLKDGSIVGNQQEIALWGRWL